MDSDETQCPTTAMEQPIPTETNLRHRSSTHDASSSSSSSEKGHREVSEAPVETTGCPDKSMGTTLFERSEAVAQVVMQEVREQFTQMNKELQLTLQRFYVTTYEMVPQFMQDNDFIRRGYRRFNSRDSVMPVKTCLRSMFAWHNETINVWTHFLGFLLFFGLMIYSTFDSTTSGWCKLAFVIYTITAQFTFAASTTMHLVCCHSAWTYFQLCKLDYQAIVSLICGSFLPVLYGGFYDDPTSGRIYLGIMILLSVPLFFALTTTKFHAPSFRLWRSLSFWGLGFFGAVPVIHITLSQFSQHGTIFTETFIRGIYPVVLMALCYGIGTGFFVSRFPERLSPGRFDILLSSHQVFHCFVVLAAFVLYKGTLDFVRWRFAQTAPLAG